MQTRIFSHVYSNFAVFLLVVTAVVFSPWGRAADTVPEAPEDSAADALSSDDILMNMSLEELLNLQVDVVSKTENQNQSIRTAPGIVTVIQRDQIIRMGAKDLIEVLRQVPGFQFGGDSSNSYYMAVRGLWAFDGKVLVLVDGHEINELLYSSVNLGNRFPLDWVQRIEIIRGPGSVMYGGSAAYGVINIVTRSAEEIEGVSAAASYSQMLDGVINENRPLSKTYGQRYVSASFGHVFNPERNLGLTVDVFGAQGMMSDRTYTDIYGDTFSMAGNSETSALTAKLGFTYRGLKVGYLVERYRTTTRDGWGENLPEAFPAYFTTSSLKLRYDVSLSKNMILTPRMTWLFQKPWSITDENAKPYMLYWEPVVHRLTPGVTLTYSPVDWFDFSVAGEYRFDYVKDDYYGFLPDPCEADYYYNTDPSTCKTSEHYHDVAVYGEGVFHTRPMDISLGLRYEYSSATGGGAVPRAALTKSFDRVHFKLLGSQAFREPSVNNLSYNPDLKRDRTTVGEAEIGLRLIDSLFWTINGFVIHVTDPIVYFYDDQTEIESFVNYKKTGTTGFETELSFKQSHHFLKLGYSWFYPVFNEVETYHVPRHGNAMLGFARNKLAASGGLEVIRNLTFNFSGSLLFGDRYGYTGVDMYYNMQLKKFGPEFIGNVYVLYRNAFTKGLSLGIGVRNIANSEINYIQPYNNWHPPNPGPGAEIFLKIGYDFPIR
ncbi:MAG: TonB-dependent receptor plug domain-containing protein [Deltaproteobacteria bacterium]|nr:TonB-dependent receptor plug domain-containing protein [Deltaproteobacteria bacterium]